MTLSFTYLHYSMGLLLTFIPNPDSARYASGRRSKTIVIWSLESMTQKLLRIHEIDYDHDLTIHCVYSSRFKHSRMKRKNCKVILMRLINTTRKKWKYNNYRISRLNFFSKFDPCFIPQLSQNNKKDIPIF